MVRLQAEPIDIRALEAAAVSPAAGAVVSFHGTVREQNGGRRVLRLEYEAYAAMAEAEMERIEREALAQWSPLRVMIVHRSGLLAIGEISVAVVAAAPHRAEAFAACRYVIEALKARVPIWKKEHYEDGAIWLERAGG